MRGREWTHGDLGPRLAGVLGALALGSSALLAGTPPAQAAQPCDGVTVPCAIGDIGPGGGIVFYDAGSVKKWGRYLEVAPPRWDGGTEPSIADPTSVGCEPRPNGMKTGTAIGTGAGNTKALLKKCGQDSAAGRSAGYGGGGQSGWFLPSRDEMSALYKAWIGNPAIELDKNSYWTSSVVSKTGDYIWFFGTEDGKASDINSYNNTGWAVRPVRAFPCTRPAGAKPKGRYAACVPVGR